MINSNWIHFILNQFLKMCIRDRFIKYRNITKAVNMIREELPESEEKTVILEFIQGSNRGIMKGHRR